MEFEIENDNRILHRWRLTIRRCSELSRDENSDEDKRVQVKGGYFYKRPLPGYTLFGRDGCFMKRRSDVQEIQLDRGLTPADPEYGREPDGSEGLPYTGGRDRTEIQRVSSPRGDYLTFYEALFRAISDDRSEPVTAADGIRVMQIIDAAVQSDRDHRRCIVISVVQAGAIRDRRSRAAVTSAIL